MKQNHKDIKIVIRFLSTNQLSAEDSIAVEKITERRKRRKSEPESCQSYCWSLHFCYQSHWSPLGGVTAELFGEVGIKFGGDY